MPGLVAAGPHGATPPAPLNPSGRRNERRQRMSDQLIRPRFRLGFLTHVQGRGDPATTYRNAQELFVVADELGFDVGWVAQHHAPLGGGGLPSPWTFLSHAAARTKRIRLSTAITVLPLENPVRLAEDVSVVDLLSGGRWRSESAAAAASSSTRPSAATSPASAS